MARTKVEGLERLKARVSALPEKAKAELRVANERNATEFEAMVRSIIPTGDPANGHLKDSLVKGPGITETGVVVTIGGPQAPYPLHLEAGHRNADGTHTPAVPFWNPAKRVLRKKQKGRATRAMNKAVKAITT